MSLLFFQQYCFSKAQPKVSASRSHEKVTSAPSRKRSAQETTVSLQTVMFMGGEMVVHTLFEIYFKLGLHFKDMSAKGVELFV